MTHRHFLLLLSVLILASVAPAFSQERILGFTSSSAAHQAKVEEKFKAIPSPAEARRQHRIFTAEPHLAGSKRNNELAQYIAAEWRKQGLEDVVIHRYDVYATAPKSASLEMVAPVAYRAGLREAPYDADPDTKNPRVSSAWTGMSTSGEVTAPVGGLSVADVGGGRFDAVAPTLTTNNDFETPSTHDHFKPKSSQKNYCQSHRVMSL